jgi:CHRD domain
MKLIKLIAFPLLITSLFTLGSCERDAEQKKTTDYERKNIPLTGAQVAPASASAALGTMDVYYSKETRVVNWSVSWSGLSGPVTSMHVHGLAPSGFTTATIVQNIIAASNGIATPNSALYGATSKFTGTLFVDGVAVKEQDVLNGMYYIDIHTAAYTNGEIRGQIIFQ